MANSKNILNTKYAPQSIRNKIIKSDRLVNYIKKDIYSIEKDLLSNRKAMEQNAKVFLIVIINQLLEIMKKNIRD